MASGIHVLELTVRLMLMRISRVLVTISAVLMATAAARAQLAVIDVEAVTQLIQEVQAMEQAVQTAENQLAQAKRTLQAMTGDRGMELLLAGTARNYLPSTWQQVTNAMQGRTGTSAALSTDVQNAMTQNAILSPRQLSTLSAASQQQIVASRQANALREAVAQEALTNASGRFASIQTLIDAIATAVDQKGILDLQARIGAELGMLENEQTKLQILQQAAEAQDSVNRQQERERVVAGHGSFASRFQPVP